MRILGDGEVANVGEGIVDEDDVLDTHADTEVDLQGGFLLAFKVGFLLQVADASADGHNFLVGELHAEMRVDAERLAVDEAVAVAVEGEVEVEGEGGVEAFAELHVLAAAEDEFRHGELELVGGNLVAGLLEHLDDAVAEVVAPRVEGGGGIAQQQSGVPPTVGVVQSHIDAKAPRVGEITDAAVQNLDIPTQRQALHLLEVMGIGEQESIVGRGEVGDFRVIYISLIIN